MTPVIYPTQRELAQPNRADPVPKERHAECTPTPYQRGFRDGRYLGVGGCIGYRNPYGIDYDKWLEYDAGFMDARKAAKAERI